MIDDLRESRRRRAGIESALGSARPGRPVARRHVGRVIDPILVMTAPAWVNTNPVAISGPDSAGSAATLTPDASLVVPVLCLGSVPSVGDYVLARVVDGRWVAQVPGIGAGGGDLYTIPTCSCPTPPVLTWTATQPDPDDPANQNPDYYHIWNGGMQTPTYKYSAYKPEKTLTFATESPTESGMAPVPFYGWYSDIFDMEMPGDSFSPNYTVRAMYRLNCSYNVYSMGVYVKQGSYIEGEYVWGGSIFGYGFQPSFGGFSGRGKCDPFLLIDPASGTSYQAGYLAAGGLAVISG